MDTTKPKWGAVIIASLMTDDISLIWSIYNNFVPLWLQAGNPVLKAHADTGLLVLAWAHLLQDLSCPTIKTTNECRLFTRILYRLWAWVRINPHYLDPEPNSTHMGKPR